MADLETIARRLIGLSEKATERPWLAERTPNEIDLRAEKSPGLWVGEVNWNYPSDAALIVEARNHIEALAREYLRLMEWQREAREVLTESADVLEGELYHKIADDIRKLLDGAGGCAALHYEHECNDYCKRGEGGRE